MKDSEEHIIALIGTANHGPLYPPIILKPEYKWYEKLLMHLTFGHFGYKRANKELMQKMNDLFGDKNE